MILQSFMSIDTKFFYIWSFEFYGYFWIGVLYWKQPICTSVIHVQAWNINNVFLKKNYTNTTNLNLSTFLLQDGCAFSAQGMVQLDQLHNNTSSSSTSSPSKSSRSVSSSPTSTLRTRARASSADDSANKKITKNVPKESIENWEIPASEILVYKKNIGMGSFGTVYRGYWHGPVAIKMLSVKNPSTEQIQAFRNEVALLWKTR